jgi:hypothetical protein
MSAPRSLSEAQAQQDAQAASENEARLKRDTFEKYPALSVEANWPVIVRFLAQDSSALNEQNIQAAVDVLTKAGSLAVLTDADLQNEQQSMANQIVGSQYRRRLAVERGSGESLFGDFRSSEQGNLKMYEIYQQRRFRQLMRTDRQTVKSLLAAEAQRDSIVQKIIEHCYKQYDPAVIAGSKQDYDRHMAEERLMWMEKPIEELLQKSASVDQSIGHQGASKEELRAEIKSADLERHPERIGASLPRTFEEAKQRDAAILGQHSGEKEVVITYSRQELLEMSRAEFRDLFMKTNPATGGLIYKSPAVEQAITAILQGKETETGKARREYLRTHYVR